MSLRPICVPCAQSMICAENDFPVRDKRTEDFPATEWLGDRFKCSCGASVVVGFGRGRVENPAAPSTALEFRR